MRSFFLYLSLCIALIACSQSRRISKNASLPIIDTSSIASLISAAQKTFINDTALAGAHVGISIYDPAASRYLYNYQGDHYFVPASNTKLFTCYAAMKYLGDSLIGVRYERAADKSVMIEGTGDPTFLHPDFPIQPVMALLQQASQIYVPAHSVVDGYNTFRDLPVGKGWAWDDYADDYAVERSEFPLYGNVARFRLQNDTLAVSPSFFYNAQIRYNNSVVEKGTPQLYTITRAMGSNFFYPVSSKEIFLAGTKFTAQEVPFKTVITSDTAPYRLHKTYVQLLKDTLHKKIEHWSNYDARSILKDVIHSQPTDSLLKPMMHRSDNFFAEQSLLMVSNEKLGYMSDEAIIDTLLKTDLKDLPQKPVWVDGSGLSRYNLFTPQDMVAVLLKMKSEFGLERIRNILPKGNTGTLTNYYQQIGPAIFAKTGSLSGQVALSGFLTCKSGKLLTFSVMVNNYTNSGRAVRRAIEKFVMQVWEND